MDTKHCNYQRQNMDFRGLFIHPQASKKKSVNKVHSEVTRNELQRKLMFALFSFTRSDAPRAKRLFELI